MGLVENAVFAFCLSFGFKFSFEPLDGLFITTTTPFFFSSFFSSSSPPPPLHPSSPLLYTTVDTLFWHLSKNFQFRLPLGQPLGSFYSHSSIDTITRSIALSNLSLSLHDHKGNFIISNLSRRIPILSFLIPWKDHNSRALK